MLLSLKALITLDQLLNVKVLRSKDKSQTNYVLYHNFVRVRLVTFVFKVKQITSYNLILSL